MVPGEPGELGADSASMVDYEPAWGATIDGMTTRVYVADDSLQVIAVPAGKQLVDLRYAPRWVPVGVAISVTVYVALVILGGFTLWGKVGGVRRNHACRQPFNAGPEPC